MPDVWWSAVRLHDELDMLHRQLALNGQKMTVTEDGVHILVYVDPAYKAYIPKKYEDFDVICIDWDGKPLTINLDFTIDLSSENNGIIISKCP